MNTHNHNSQSQPSLPLVGKLKASHQSKFAPVEMKNIVKYSWKKLKKIESEKMFEVPSKFLLPAAYMTKEDYEKTRKEAKKQSIRFKSKSKKNLNRHEILVESEPQQSENPYNDVEVIEEDNHNDYRNNELEQANEKIDILSNQNAKRQNQHSVEQSGVNQDYQILNSNIGGSNIMSKRLQSQNSRGAQPSLVGNGDRIIMQSKLIREYIKSTKDYNIINDRKKKKKSKKFIKSAVEANNENFNLLEHNQGQQPNIIDQLYPKLKIETVPTGQPKPKLDKKILNYYVNQEQQQELIRKLKTIQKQIKFQRNKSLQTLKSSASNVMLHQNPSFQQFNLAHQKPQPIIETDKMFFIAHENDTQNRKDLINSKQSRTRQNKDIVTPVLSGYYTNQKHEKGFSSEKSQKTTYRTKEQKVEENMKLLMDLDISEIDDSEIMNIVAQSHSNIIADDDVDEMQGIMKIINQKKST
ncbi:UNKNOWN [Stylonychia lemnae]|uniref:Uncharacterized protein n=1 Tax=Stylonychia lemnae TaxID=5949 RepID=A0A078B626_STYLE|nr:UNKNOWN [Stylonychia lemnae]|eukprot:CDW88958.1 UNKNOWN [Stylonychia lemnae]